MTEGEEAIPILGYGVSADATYADFQAMGPKFDDCMAGN